MKLLRAEAEFYGITPLIKRVALCEDLSHSSCGDVLFYGYLPPARKIGWSYLNLMNLRRFSTNVSAIPVYNDTVSKTPICTAMSKFSGGLAEEVLQVTHSGRPVPTPGSIIRVPEPSIATLNNAAGSGTGQHSRNSSYTGSSVTLSPGFSWNGSSTSGSRSNGQRGSTVEVRPMMQYVVL